MKQRNASNAKGWRLPVVVVLLFVTAGVAMYLARTPIRRASLLKPGDSDVVVHNLMGEPDRVFETAEQIRASYKSYVFKDSRGRAVDELPPVDGRAEWFELGSAGHLVYFDDEGVTQVIWGGT